MLENEICGLGVPLAKAFDKISSDQALSIWNPLFIHLAKVMKDQGSDAGTAWKQALLESAATLPFDTQELEQLEDFGDMLGKSDKEMQLTVLKMERDKISSMEFKAKEAMDTTGKLYRNLGALFGAAAVILLI